MAGIVTAAAIVGGAVVATLLVLALATWLLGKAEDRAERRAAEDWAESERPPKHRAPTLGRPPSSRMPWT